MTDPVIARKSPFEVELTEGKSYAWCACGRSRKQPYCDGSHDGTGILPLVQKAAKSETAYLCGCKRTATAPFCDGTHNGL